MTGEPIFLKTKRFRYLSAQDAAILASVKDRKPSLLGDDSDHEFLESIEHLANMVLEYLAGPFLEEQKERTRVTEARREIRTDVVTPLRRILEALDNPKDGSRTEIIECVDLVMRGHRLLSQDACSEWPWLLSSWRLQDQLARAVRAGSSSDQDERSAAAQSIQSMVKVLEDGSKPLSGRPRDQVTPLFVETLAIIYETYATRDGKRLRATQSWYDEQGIKGGAFLDLVYAAGLPLGFRKPAMRSATNAVLQYRNRARKAGRDPNRRGLSPGDAWLRFPGVRFDRD